MCRGPAGLSAGPVEDVLMRLIFSWLFTSMFYDKHKSGCCVSNNRLLSSLWVSVCVGGSQQIPYCKNLFFYAVTIDESSCYTSEAKMHYLKTPCHVLFGVMGSLSMFVKLFQ